VAGRLRETRLPILAGVAALESLRQAEFMASEVVGVRVADTVLERLRAAGDEAAEGMAITREIVHRLRDCVQGIHITTLHGSPAAAERLLSELGLPGSRQSST
jgi:homocysteine S-methyltransferase